MHLVPRSLVLLVLLSLLAACGPSTSSTSSVGQVNSGAPAADRPAAPKVLTLVGREGIIGNFPGVTGGGGARNYFVLDYLTATDPHEEEVPRLAQEVISIDNGTWKINADYNGRNLAGYSNPRFDAILDTLHRTIDQNEAGRVHRDLVREAFTDLAIMPFYFQMTPLIMREGITGPAGGVDVYWNLYTWDRQS